MKIVGIFAILDKKLLAVQFEGKDADEFTLAFRNWQDPEYLEDFFEKHQKDLNKEIWGFPSVEEAIWKTIEEAGDFEEELLTIARKGSFDEKSSLGDLVFRPLHKYDESIKHLESKAYGSKGKSWIRLYAIRISSLFYVVSGGAIKLTLKMKDRDHTLTELEKLKATKAYLEAIGLFDEDDYEIVEITNRDEQE